MNPRANSPFADVRPAVLLAAVYGVAVLVWIAAGADLPGGRWFAVHLFTLGVLSNLVMALGAHFATTLLHQPVDGRATARTALFNAGALCVLAGVPTGNRWSLVVGATATSAAVLWHYAALRRIRKAALTQRFGFVVRTYERACGAFLHGAILGGLIGSGALPGSWAGAARTAHLHVNVLGWGGLTLLATVVVFGPTVMRARMSEGADATAATWLGRGATSLTIGVLALVATGASGWAGVLARGVATLGVAGFAIATLAVGLPVVRAAKGARPSANGLAMAAACCWFAVAAWLDVLLVATAQWHLLSAVGAVVLVGVLGQAIVAAVGYLAPLLWSAGDRRGALRARLDRAPVLRPALFNLAVLALAAGVAFGVGRLAAVAWAAVLLWLAAQAGMAVWQKNVTEP